MYIVKKIKIKKVFNFFCDTISVRIVYPSEINSFIFHFLKNHPFHLEFQGYLRSIKQTIFLLSILFHCFFWLFLILLFLLRCVYS